MLIAPLSQVPNSFQLSILRTHLSQDQAARRPQCPSGGRVAFKELGLRSSSDERQSGWKSASGERSIAVSSPEGLGSGPEGTHELGVELIENPARGLCGCVDKRRGRPGETVGAGLRVLRQDRLDAEHSRTGPPSHQGGLLLDLFHEASIRWR
jgi:hypothetical protein